MPERDSEDVDWLTRMAERYQRPLVSYAFSMLGEIESARDAAQEALLRLCRQRRSSIEAKVASWLFTVCRNHCLDQLRHRPRKEQIGLDADRVDSPECTPLETMAHDESIKRLRGNLSRLPEPRRHALLLRFEGGLSYKEIAEVMDIKVGYVGWLIHEGLSDLRSAMEKTDSPTAETQPPDTTSARHPE